MRKMTAYVVLVTLSLSIFTHCEEVSWLMQGEYQTGDTKIDTKQVYFPASTMVDALYQMEGNKTITLIIAAAIHMNGFVSVLDGGLNSQYVKLRYRTRNGKPDIFVVVIQSAERKPLQPGIIYGRSRNVQVYIYSGL